MEAGLKSPSHLDKWHKMTVEKLLAPDWIISAAIYLDEHNSKLIFTYSNSGE